MLYADEEAKGDGLSEGGSQAGELLVGGQGLKSRKHRRTAVKAPLDCTSKFHFSIAWQLQEPTRELMKSTHALASMEHFKISFECLKVKIGNAIHDIPLSEHILSEQHLGGL